MPLNTSRDGEPTNSLGNLFLCFTILTGKNSFTSKLNIFSLNPFPLSCYYKQSFSIFLLAPFRYWKTAIRSPQSLVFNSFMIPILSTFPNRRGAPSIFLYTKTLSFILPGLSTSSKSLQKCLFKNIKCTVISRKIYLIDTYYINQ